MITYPEFLMMADGSLTNPSQEPIEQAILNATKQIERHCNRVFYPALYTARLSEEEKDVIVSATPIIQVVTTGSEFVSENRIIFSEAKKEVKYIAGFSPIPDDVKRTCFRIAMYEVSQARERSYSVTSKGVNTGGVSTNYTKTDPSFVATELGKLNKYINMHYYAFEKMEPIDGVLDDYLESEF